MNENIMNWKWSKKHKGKEKKIRLDEWRKWIENGDEKLRKKKWRNKEWTANMMKEEKGTKDKGRKWTIKNDINDAK